MPAAVEDKPPLIDRVLDGFDDVVLHRYPHVVGPPFVAALAFGLAEGAHLGGPFAVKLLWLLTFVVFFLGTGHIWDLPGPREKAYALACWVVGCGWTAYAGWYGPLNGSVPLVGQWAGMDVPPLVAAWAVALTAAWPPWTHHRRIRRSVAVAAEILAWDGEAVGLKEVRLSTAGAKADGDGWEAPLIPDTPGQWTTDKLRKAIPQIASHYGRAIHEFTIDKVRGDREGKWVLRFREARKRAPVVYQPPIERPSARKPFTIGHVTADPTTPLQAEVWRENWGGVDSLITGMKGHGKTVALQRVALHAISARDGLLFLGDLAPGSPDYSVIDHKRGDLRPGIGTRGAYVYATTVEQVDTMVLVLLALCRIRGQRPQRNRRLIFVALDEMALYFAPTRPAGTSAADRARAYRIDEQRLAQITNLAAISRKYDIAIWGIAQKGKEKNTGGDLRTLISAGQIIGFHSPKASDGMLVSADSAFDPSQLPRGVSGQCLVSNGHHPEVVRGTLWNVTGQTIFDVLERFASHQGGLDDDELAALRDEFGDTWDDLRLANRGSVPVVPDSQPEPEPEPQPEPETPIIQPAPRRAMNRAESQQTVWNALAALGKPVLARDVAKAIDKDYEIVRVRLKELVELGRVKQHGAGKWIKYEAVRSDSDG